MILTHNGDTVGFVTGGSDVGKVNQASKALPPHCAAELGEVGSMQFASVHKVTCPWQSQHTVLFLSLTLALELELLWPCVILG